MVDISNITQALAMAKTTDQSTFEHGVLVVALLDDGRNVVEELNVTKHYYQLATVPLLMIEKYFKEFAAQLAEHEFPTTNEVAAAELAKKTAEEADAITDKLRTTLTALEEAMSTYDDLTAMTLGMAQGTKDLAALISRIQNN